MIKRARIFANSFLSSSSFVNIQDAHPPLFALIKWDSVVLSREKLENGKWLYVGEDDKKIVEDQLHVLKFYNDGLVIVRE